MKKEKQRNTIVPALIEIEPITKQVLFELREHLYQPDRWMVTMCMNCGLGECREALSFYDAVLAPNKQRTKLFTAANAELVHETMLTSVATSHLMRP